MFPPGCARTRDQPNTDGIAIGTKNDGYRAGGLLGCKSGGCADRYNDIDVLSHQVCRKILQPCSVAFGRSALNDEVLPFHVTHFLKLAHKRHGEKRTVPTCLKQPKFKALLCSRGKRPRDHGAAEQSSEIYAASFDHLVGAHPSATAPT